MRNTRHIEGIVFDKDGTLFDFHTTWNVWTSDLIQSLADAHDVPPTRIAEAVQFDLATRAFHPDSPIIAATNREGAEAIASALPGVSVDMIEEEMMLSAAHAPLAPAVDLAPFLDDLKARGLKLGVMTNDSEYGARAHLTSAGVLERFDFVAGFDSGFGGKPAPAPLLAFARSVGLDPEACVMVGDSTHDLMAGRAARMGTVGVLTGVAPREVLDPFADVVLPDIGHIPQWLQR
ncbi:HAD family hydrolase [Roseovarius sp. LXJ103]|uniref:HAD family hydrolase n=1 Tax=Roseovarius carneus TaxID=2853164 RepID=UPI000D6218BC|nr:HAD family hydrolase [Roseovarius carneus]MBZ8117178.1 HAD family hydrolase [Roseovarius carneus]PWE36983.1 phosphatase [Pelagicola sp. LXJ1103]